jgi:predicted component of type VI protein secretion system
MLPRQPNIARAEKRYYDGMSRENGMKATLLVVAGKTTKGKVALKLPCVLGRSREADVTVPHALISRRHCELSETDGLIMLRDLASLNGTMIGGRRIASAPLLPDGEFTIGPLTFRVLYRYDGDLESLPPTNFVEEAGEGEEVEFAEAESWEDEAPVPSGDDPSEEMPPSLSDSDVVEVPDFVAMADADPDEIEPAFLTEPEDFESTPDDSAGFPWPPATSDLMPTEFEEIPEPKESPWATEAPEVESAKSPTAKPKAPAAQTPPPPTKKPNYGDDVDPEFGSFLEDLK